jgi:hypothetical protein
VSIVLTKIREAYLMSLTQSSSRQFFKASNKVLKDVWNFFGSIKLFSKSLMMQMTEAFLTDTFGFPVLHTHAGIKIIFKMISE